MNPWLRIFRLHNAAIAGAGVWLGWASLRTPRPDIALALWGCLSMVLLTTAGNVDNDVCDVETDRLNRPRRPLPAGELGLSSVRLVAWMLYILGIAAAWAASPRHGALAAGMTLLLLAYNRRLKGLPLLGNLAVALLCALAIYFPEFPQWPHAVLPACAFAFVATLAREIIKDLEDMEGDRAMKWHTLPLLGPRGPQRARKLAFTLGAVLLACLPLPLFLFGYPWQYLLFSTLLAGPFLVAFLWELSKGMPNYRRSQGYLKGTMVGGMIALLIAVLS